MANEIVPLVSLERLKFFGNPHHGLVENGVMTKADGSVLAWPQPEATFSPQRGNTRLIKFDNAPAINRTSAEQLADNASGYDWLDYAILSSKQLYGKEVGDVWLYKDPAGSVWAIDATLQSQSAATFTIRLTYTSFGFVKIPDPLQPALTGFIDVVVSTDITNNINVFWRPDVSPNGKKGIFFASYESARDVAYTQRVIQKNAVEIALDGIIDPGTMSGLSATAVVVSNSAQSVVMLSTGVVEISPASVKNIYTTFTTTGSRPNWNATDAAAPVDVTMTAHYSVTSQTISGGISPSIYVDPNPVPLPNSFDIPQQYTEDITVKLLENAFYNTSNELKLIHVNITYVEAVLSPSIVSIGQSISLIQTSKVFIAGVDTPGGLAPLDVATGSGSGQLTVNIGWRKTRLFTYEVIVDGATQDSISLSSDNLHNKSYNISFGVHDSILNASSWYTAATFPASGSGSQSDVQIWASTDWNGVVYNAPNNLLLFYRDAVRISALRLYSDVGGDDRGFLNYNMFGIDAVSLTQLSNSLSAIRINSDSKSRQFYRGTIHPGGFNPFKQDFPYVYSPALSGKMLYATYHPLTNNIITKFGNYGDAALYTCFV